MRKRLSIVLSILICFMAAIAFSKVPEKVTVGEAAKKQTPVTFDHAKHATTYAKSCGVCHHTQKALTKDDTKTKVEKCSACHLDPKGKEPSMRDATLTKNPMHVRCVGCHKEQKKGPVACTGCHAKKK